MNKLIFTFLAFMCVTVYSHDIYVNGIQIIEISTDKTPELGGDLDGAGFDAFDFNDIIANNFFANSNIFLNNTNILVYMTNISTSLEVDTTNASGINADFAVPTNYFPSDVHVDAHLRAIDAFLADASAIDSNNIIHVVGETSVSSGNRIALTTNITFLDEGADYFTYWSFAIQFTDDDNQYVRGELNVGGVDTISSYWANPWKEDTWDTISSNHIYTNASTNVIFEIQSNPDDLGKDYKMGEVVLLFRKIK